MKKKLMFFLYSLSGGGAERTVINIINNLNKEKYEIILVLGSKNENDYLDLVADHVNIYFLNTSKLRYSLFKLVRAIKKHKPDLLFSTIYQNNIMLLVAKLLCFKQIPTIIRETSNRVASGTVTVINKVVILFLYNLFADKVIALSKGVEESLITNFYVKKSKVKHIYNPVEVNSIQKLSNEKVTDIKRIRKHEKLVIAVGRLVEAKDYYTLLKAFKIVNENINTRLIILGKGPLEDELIEFCKKLGIEKRVVFMGFKKNPYKYMREADVFVLSSKWEGFGHVIVEAMATGTPVISTNCRSGPEEIIDHKYGVLVNVEDYTELGSKILEMLENDEIRDYYGKSGLERAESFKATEIVKEYEILFESTL